MTQSQPDRLDRIEALVQSNAEAIAINAQAAATNTRNIDQLSVRTRLGS